MQRPMCSPMTDLPQTDEQTEKENAVRPKREDPHETPSQIGWPNVGQGRVTGA